MTTARLRISALLIAMLALAAVGCSASGNGNGNDGEPMLVAEYAAWCASNSDSEFAKIADDATWGEVLEAMESLLAESREITPPPELADWHNVNVRGSVYYAEVIKSFDQNERHDFTMLIVPAMQVGGELDAAEASIDDATHSALSDAGCVDAR